MRVRLPADVDMADRIFAGLTARQLAILGVDAVILLGLYAAGGTRLPVPVFLVIAAPLVALGLLWAMTSPEGTTFESLARSALGHFIRPRKRVLAPEGLPEVPDWWEELAPSVAPLELPLGDPTGDGHVELGSEGAVAICRASPVNFALRSEAEQRALVEGFARLLNALDAPAQFLVRSNRADLRELLTGLEEQAVSLPNQGLEAAAREHAAFLRSLASRRDVLSRQVLVCFREPAGGEEELAALDHRVEEAGALLRGMGVRLSRLEGDEAGALLARAADPEHLSGAGTSSGVVEGRW